MQLIERLIYPWEGNVVIFQAKLGISVVISVCTAAGAGVGLAAVPATAALAAARPVASVHHVAPFGAGAARAVRHARRHAAASSVSVTTGTTLWVSNTVPVGNDTSCASPGYSTISAALTAAAAAD